MPSEETASRLSDIVENIDRIEGYTEGLTLTDFEATPVVIDAVERCLQRVTEAAIKAQPHAEEVLPLHDWKAMRNFGNVLRHDYNRVSLDVVWWIVKHDLPALRHDCARAIVELEGR